MRALAEAAAALVAVGDVPPAPAGAVPAWLAPLAARPGLGACIDHTLLKPEATAVDVDRVADEGRALAVAAVCVNGAWVARVTARLAGSGVATAAVIGFPLGAMASGAKADETRRAVAEGATEIDMVLALGLAKAGAWEAAGEDIAAVVGAAGSARVKVILETAALTPLEIACASLVSVEAGAAFVKTSTGFHPAGGATEAAVRLMRRAVGTRAGVKASGGIRSGDAALRMLAAGADRLGTSSTLQFTGLVGPGAPTLADLLVRPLPEPGSPSAASY